MPRNLDSSTTGIGDPYKFKKDHHVACATDRNVHTVLLYIFFIFMFASTFFMNDSTFCKKRPIKMSEDDDELKV